MVEYPLYWESQKLKYLFTYSLSSVDRHQYDDEKSVNVCHYPDVYRNEKIGSVKNLPTGTCSEEEFQKFKVYPGDILITKDSESRDIGVACLISDSLIDTVCGYHLGIIRPGYGLNPGYFFRFLQTQIVKGHFYGECSGITRFSLGKSSVENLVLPVPPPEEQKLISLYLDKKTEQIDSLVGKIQRKIELLKEQRESLINRCITKGLDPNVEMKDSGIDWIGEIPDHWGLQRLKYVSQHIVEKRFPIEGDIKISPENVESDTGRVLDFYSDYDSEGQEFLPGDILFNKLRVYLNKVVLTDFAGLSMGEMIVLRPRGIYPEYLSKVMTSKIFIDEINSLSEGVKLPRPPLEGIMNSLVPVPLPEEQKLISLYLDKKTEQIDSLIEKIQRKIELLSECRQSLISSVVIGKVRITEDMI